MKQTNVRQFFKQFPSDEACLEHLFNIRFSQGHTCPKCDREAKWYRLASEQAYSCQWCGQHIHPMVGSIFEKSRTPLQHWFYTIFLFTTSRHGVSGKELQRQLGVTYKTAHRMGTLIRKHMADVDGEATLGGKGKVVEIDETYVGGKVKGMDWRKNKTVVMGMVERDGDVMFKVVDYNKRESLMPQIQGNVSAGSEIHTDKLKSFRGAQMAPYTHKTVNHSKGEYAKKDGTTTNSTENFFGHLKRSIAGAHISVSPAYLEIYVKEFEYRFNRWTKPEAMLGELLSRFPELDA